MLQQAWMLWTDLPRADPCVVEEAPTEGANLEAEGHSTEAVEEEESLLEEARTAKTDRNVRTADIFPMPEGKSAQQEGKDAVHATNTTIQGGLSLLPESGHALCKRSHRRHILPGQHR